jgi:hypothetical protein
MLSGYVFESSVTTSFTITMSLRGISTQESFVFKIIGQSPDGRTAAPARG